MPGTVQFFRNNAGANSSTLQVWARKLHELLIAAGWTLEYANADAIGTGSAGSPAWDKAIPSVTTSTPISAGIAIYKMPLNGKVTPWFVKIEPSWSGSNTAGTAAFLAVTTATGQVNGVLQNPGQTVATRHGTTSNIGNTNFELIINTHPDAFCVALLSEVSNAPAWVLSVGRTLNLDAVTTDDISISGVGANAVSLEGPVGMINVGSAMKRSITQGESSANRYVCFTSPGTSATTCAEPVTLNFPAAAVGFIIGPFLLSGGIGGPPRLWTMVATNDSVAGMDQLYLVDGEEREYFVSAANGASRFHGRLAFARE